MGHWEKKREWGVKENRKLSPPSFLKGERSTSSDTVGADPIRAEAPNRKATF